MRLGFALVLLLSALAVRGAHAQASAPHDDTPRVMVLVDAGVSATASRLRAQLTKQAGVKVLDFADAPGGENGPSVLITVSRGAGDKLRVMYWDSMGNVDSLSAPTPSGDGVLELVASTLASALLQHNLPRLVRAKRPADPACASCGMKEVVADLKAYARLIGRPPHRSLPIYEEDF